MDGWMDGLLNDWNRPDRGVKAPEMAGWGRPTWQGPSEERRPEGGSYCMEGSYARRGKLLHGRKLLHIEVESTVWRLHVG